jgi:hypothetical protein
MLTLDDCRPNPDKIAESDKDGFAWRVKLICLNSPRPPITPPAIAPAGLEPAGAAEVVVVVVVVDEVNELVVVIDEDDELVVEDEDDELVDDEEEIAVCATTLLVYEASHSYQVKPDIGASSYTYGTQKGNWMPVLRSSAPNIVLTPLIRE